MSGPAGPTLDALAADLAAGRTTSRALVEACLARIADPAGEGGRAFLQLDAEGARKAADAMDALRAAKAAPSPYAGIPVSVKDLFDVAGQVTRAGSRALDDTPPADSDAMTVARLRRAGFVVVGRTNMTEFAYSGLGINPHYGTPRSPWRRDEGHVPGGSSSGAAISVTDGMAHAALGTDTGGSCRIPAAFNGLVGFKPTARRVPLEGSVPLSWSLDSIGPIARSTACCAVLDSVLAGEAPEALPAVPLEGLRLLLPETVALDGMEEAVATAFETALARLSRAGVRITRAAMPEFAEVAPMNALGGFTASESFAWHRKLLDRRGGDYDPRVSSRIKRGAGMSAADYLDLQRSRADFIRRATARIAAFDALVMPTAPILPPRIAALEDEAAYTAANLAALRNPTLVNMMDGCAISVPAARPPEAPVGVMLAAAGGGDRRLLAIAASVESALAA
ncbi:aspartyl-tRNA(Asn)/glutamyl-tRNA(Gln) amidotransferase subunit A [Roseomonas rosea]|uniref:Aspartyl-tRNA(Asn)/glutamyl-tRNA(Gln) amidotransferase subunit A n=1 Tax=Muricoccus roseus TaxID=198092 RepID=A0A1M6FK49_9PROT|nr:amidase [Roseomonas rosea]SHI98045.1 aspartyl-tRNA(Asn)/glutamyl-tRNA(Gln) amidotransferase subunit A [Roseomonas rosea]